MFSPIADENKNKSICAAGKKAPISKKSQQARFSTEEELTVAPRKGSIEVRKMRLRVKLFEQGQVGDITKVGDNNATQNTIAESENNDQDFVGSDGWNNNALVVRRKDSVLVSTRRGMGALVFRFKSVKHCLEFCDRLVLLNQDYFLSSSKPNDGIFDGHGTSNQNGLDQRELNVDGVRSNKRRKADMMGDQLLWNSSLLPLSDADEVDGKARTGGDTSNETLAKQYRRKDEVLAYIVKLAQNEEFRGFVDELERGLDTVESSKCLGSTQSL